jgi:hypothetical protein
LLHSAATFYFLISVFHRTPLRGGAFCYRIHVLNAWPHTIEHVARSHMLRAICFFSSQGTAMRGGLFIEVREYIALSAHSDEWVPAALGGIWCSVEKLQMQSFRNRQDAQARSRRDEPCRETSLTRIGEQACLGRGSACPLSIKKPRRCRDPLERAKSIAWKWSVCSNCFAFRVEDSRTIGRPLETRASFYRVS